MSKIAVHLDPETQHIEGIWTNETGTPTSFYPNGIAFPYQAGRSHIEAWSPNSDVTWNQFCEYLAGRTPNRVWWEQADLEKGETPEAAYRRLTKL